VWQNSHTKLGASTPLSGNRARTHVTDQGMQLMIQIARELRQRLLPAAIAISGAILFGLWTDDLRVSSVQAMVLMLRSPEQRLFAQTQAVPQSESLLRKTIQDLQQGKPDFESMEPQLQKAVKEQSEHTASIYRHLGALQALKYIGSKDGTDLYRAVYQNAAVTYTIRLSASGKISALLLQPAFPWDDTP
jgi:hypothetical protein